jgi:hypothetical protein
MTSDQKNRYYKIFKHPSFQLMEMTKPIAGKAATIREYYDTRKFDPKTGALISGSLMALGDAIHLATALNYDEVVVFRTLGGTSKNKKRLDLLKLDGNVAGARLSIKIPKYVPPPEPLKGPIKQSGGEQLSLEIDQSKINEEDANTKAETTNTAAEPSPAELQPSCDGHTQDQTVTQNDPPAEKKDEVDSAPVGAVSAERTEGQKAGK